jgi:hypothetical protein
MLHSVSDIIFSRDPYTRLFIAYGDTQIVYLAYTDHYKEKATKQQQQRQKRTQQRNKHSQQPTTATESTNGGNSNNG